MNIKLSRAFNNMLRFAVNIHGQSCQTVHKYYTYGQSCQTVHKQG